MVELYQRTIHQAEVAGTQLFRNGYSTDDIWRINSENKEKAKQSKVDAKEAK